MDCQTAVYAKSVCSKERGTKASVSVNPAEPMGQSSYPPMVRICETGPSACRFRFAANHAASTVPKMPDSRKLLKTKDFAVSGMKGAGMKRQSFDGEVQGERAAKWLKTQDLCLVSRF